MKSVLQVALAIDDVLDGLADTLPDGGPFHVVLVHQFHHALGRVVYSPFLPEAVQ